MDVARSYQLSGVPTQRHVGVQLLQDEVVPLLQLVPQDFALDEVRVRHVRNVPHAPGETRDGERGKKASICGER